MGVILLRGKRFLSEPKTATIYIKNNKKYFILNKLMEINYTMVVAATLVQFVLGAVWYSPLMFGKMWMQIMEVSHYTKEELQKMQKSMTPFYGLQLVLTLITTFCLANVLGMGKLIDPNYSAYMGAFWTWFGFMMPVGVAGVIWSSTKRKYWPTQIAIMCGMQLVGVMLAAWILSM
jgi:hypothetical protein